MKTMGGLTQHIYMGVVDLRHGLRLIHTGTDSKCYIQKLTCTESEMTNSLHLLVQGIVGGKSFSLMYIFS